MAMDRNAQARAQFNTRMRGGLLQQQESAEITEQDKKILGTAVQAVGQMLYSDKVAKSTAEMVREPPHVEAIGDVAAQLTMKVDEQMDVPEDLIIPLGVLVAEMVSDIGEELGFYKESKEFVNKCVQHTIKKLYEIYGTDEEGLVAETEGMSAEEIQGGMPQDEEPEMPMEEPAGVPEEME